MLSGLLSAYLDIILLLFASILLIKLARRNILVKLVIDFGKAFPVSYPPEVSCIPDIYLAFELLLQLLQDEGDGYWEDDEDEERDDEDEKKKSNKWPLHRPMTLEHSVTRFSRYANTNKLRSST